MTRQASNLVSSTLDTSGTRRAEYFVRKYYSGLPSWITVDTDLSKSRRQDKTCDGTDAQPGGGNTTESGDGEEGRSDGSEKTGRYSELVAWVPSRGFYRLDGLKLWEFWKAGKPPAKHIDPNHRTTCAAHLRRARRSGALEGLLIFER
jgi:hypothetical protein